MGKIHQSPKMPAETRREQLMRSAAKLFAEKGYEGTSTEEIARRAGLTKGALYFHFKSKEDMLFALVSAMEDRHREAFERLAAGKITPSGYLKALFTTDDSGRFLDGKALVDIGAQAIRIPRMRRHMKKSHRQHVQQFCRLIDPKLGYSPNRLHQLGVLISSLYHGLCVTHWIDPKLVDVDAQMALFRSLLECSREGRRTRNGKAKR
jgi:AcrR family transcriptional regulator